MSIHLLSRLPGELPVSRNLLNAMGSLLSPEFEYLNEFLPSHLDSKSNSLDLDVGLISSKVESNLPVSDEFDSLFRYLLTPTLVGPSPNSFYYDYVACADNNEFLGISEPIASQPREFSLSVDGIKVTTSEDDTFFQNLLSPNRSDAVSTREPGETVVQHQLELATRLQSHREVVAHQKARTTTGSKPSSTYKVVKHRPKGSKQACVPIKISYEKLKLTTKLGAELSDSFVETVESSMSASVRAMLAERKLPEELENGASRCKIDRQVYERPLLIEEMEKFCGHPKVRYIRNSNFGRTPYEAEYYLYQVDNKGQLINHTRHGLCPYCPEVLFFKLKNSAYGNHLGNIHGIRTNGSLFPDPILPGIYLMAKSEFVETERKTLAKERATAGVVCQACYTIQEMQCTLRSTDLGHYLRHYRDNHVKCKSRSKGCRSGRSNLEYN